MTKKYGVILCYGLSLLLLIGFVVQTLVDYSRYDSTLNSAPFSLWVWVNAVCFLLPAVIALTIGLFIGKKAKKSKENILPSSK